MAIPYTRGQTYQHSHTAKKLVDNIFDHDPLLTKFLDKSERKTGRTVRHPVEHAKSTQRGWYSGMDPLHTADEETDTMTDLAWKACEVSVVLPSIEVAKNEGETRILDLKKRAWEKAEKNMKDQLITAIYSDGTSSSSKELTGLKAAIDDGTSIDSYAGINRDNETWWQSYYSNVAGALSLDVLRTAYSGVKSGPKKPDIIVTDEDEFDAYEALLEPNIRYTIEQNGGMKSLSRKGKGQSADGGFEYLLYRSTPILSSEYVDDGYMYLLNLDSLHWNYMKHPDFPTDKYGFAEGPDLRPTDQDGTVKRIHSYVQLTCDELRRNGKLIGLTD